MFIFSFQGYSFFLLLGIICLLKSVKCYNFIYYFLRYLRFKYYSKISVTMQKRIFGLFFLLFIAVGLSGQTYMEYVKQALEAMSMDSTDLAEQWFREAMRVEPAQRSNAMIYYQIAQMYKYKGRNEKALEYYTMGLNTAPHNVTLRMARGGLYLLMGNLNKALVDYSDVLDWNEDQKDALFMRAYIYKEKHLYKEARADYETLLELDPANEEARIGLVIVNENDNRPREAMEQINAMIIQTPDHAVLFAIRAGMEQARKQYEAAEDDFTTAIELDPGNVDYFINRASLYIETKREKEARADLDKAMELGANPDDVASLRHELR